jgi:hypothetical protein
MIRIVTQLFAAVALIAFFQVAPLSAAPVAYVSSTGSDANSCTAAQPCATISAALNQVDSGGQITCLDPAGVTEGLITVNVSVTIDCSGALLQSGGFNGFIFQGTNQVLKIRNLTFNGNAASANPAIRWTGSGSLILENCVFENFAGSSALDIEPTGAFNLVVTNGRISNSGAGVLLRPAGTGITATFDGVTIADNLGGGIKTDTTNGPINLVISNSTISHNAGNGLNAVANGQQNVLELIHDVIASNGTAGIQANGSGAAVLVNNTLLDVNTNGATSVINGGRVLTYGNNSIVGPAGSGFTASTPLQ